MRSKFKWIYALLVALTMQFSFAQDKTVTGTISDAQGALPGANILVKGTTRRVTTDFDGKYAIKAKEGEVLVFSFVEMANIERTVGASNVISVSMKSSNILNEVVVQGYRTVTKKSAVVSSASVSSKTIENRPNANVMNTLQGQLAGVNIASGTGQPGAKSTVIIRGLGTLTGNSDPLYVIDGFPSNSDNFRSFNSNDIESVSVLKDAAAISEYGSRGSNGVIVVKTKTASFGENKTTFRYSSVYGLTNLQRPKYNFANAQQLLQIEKNAETADPVKYFTFGGSLTDAQIASYGVNQDWVNYFFNQGTSSNNNISIENNGKNLNAFTSIGYFTQDGILKTTGLQRFNFRSNINGKSENERFKFQVVTSLGHSKNNEATNLGTGAINRNYVLGAYQAAPYLAASTYVNSGQTLLDYAGVNAVPNGTDDLSQTPYFLIDKLQQYSNLTEETRFDVATDFSYKLAKGLTARSKVSGQLLSTRFFQAENPRSFNALLFNRAGLGSVINSVLANTGVFTEFDGFEDINQRREFIFNNLWQLNYNKVIGKHTFNISANAEYNHSRLNTNNLRQNGLDIGLFVPNTGVGYIADNTTGTNDFYVPTISAANVRTDLISYFGSVDYDFNSKFGLVGSYRWDSSSRFLADDRLGQFYSIGGRYNLDEESFIKNLNFVNVLKLRGSYGTVGNLRILDGSVYAGINPPRYVTTFAAAAAAGTYAGASTYVATIGSAGLRWETTKSWNVGLDFELFNSRIKGAFDVYNKKTVDLFFTDPQASIIGASSFLRNSNTTVNNNGVELNLSYDVIRDKVNDITLTVRGNGAYNKNRVDGITVNNGKITNGNLVNRNGGPAFEYNLIPYAGVNPVNGNLLFQSALGGLTENPTENDRVLTGKNYLPVYQGGFGFDLNVKGFFLSSNFTFAQQVWRFDYDEAALYQQSGIGDFNKSSDLLNSWTPSNTGSNLPSLAATNEGQDGNSDRYLRDASYIRLRNVQFGYVVPKRFLDKTFIKGLTFTLQGENLVTFTKWKGFDAESTRTNDQSQYPTPKIVTFGVDLKF